MSRETKSRINAQLRRLKREDKEQEYIKVNLPKASDQLRAKLDTTIGRDLTEIGGIKPLDVVQNAKGDVIQGEGVALITENLPSISGANDPGSITLPYSAGSLSTNFGGSDSGFNSSFNVSATKTGGTTAQPISTILGDITGAPALKLSLPKLNLNIAGGGSPTSIAEGIDGAVAKSSAKASSIADAASGIASSQELTEIATVTQNLDASGAAGEVTKLITAIPDLKTTKNPEDVLGNVENKTGVKELQAKSKETKLKLQSFSGVTDFVGKIKDLAGDIGEFVNKATDAIATVVVAVATGLDGVLQNITEKITLNTENKVKGITGSGLESTELRSITEDIAKKTPQSDANAIKSVLANADIGDKMKDIVDKVESPTSPLDFKNEIKDKAEKSGVSKDEIDNATNTVDRADKEIKSLNTTIAGQMVLDANFYDLPKPIGEEITKWSGKNSGNEVFTFVSSVEELNSEIHAISRPLSEVVIHATETATDKDIGAIEINNIQSELGHDGISYHYVIRRDGRLQRGRPPDRVGDHTSANGHNNHSLGIVLVGGINVATGDTDADVDFDGAVVIDGAISITTDVAGGTVDDGKIDFSTTINAEGSGTDSLTLDSGAGTITLGGVIGGSAALDALTIDTTALTISNNITTGNGLIDINAPVTLGGAVVISSGTGGGNVDFSSTITGGQNLDILSGTGNVIITGNIGATALTSLDINQSAGTGDITLSGDIGAHNAAGAGVVRLGNDSLTGTITFGGADYNTTGAQTYKADAYSMTGIQI